VRRSTQITRVSLPNGEPAILKLGVPHYEAEGEIAGLRFWNGDGTVRLLDADESNYSLLLELCDPGTPLSDRPAPEQDEVIAKLLKRLWRPAPKSGFRPLAEMLARWSDEVRARESEWKDRALVEEGLAVFREFSAPYTEDALLFTDLHAGNVLASQREPWLAIDPKPFVGDRSYDATQHLLNCLERVLASPTQTIESFADRLELSHDRVRRWLFARAAVESRSDWGGTCLDAIAWALRP
jgi:streptomycin 6-kinase